MSAASTQSILATVKAELKSDDHLALVFYRGHWCPFCAGYLKTIEKEFVPGFKALGGKVIAVTSESEPLAKKAKATWGTSFVHISDPSNILAEKFGVHITPKEKTFHKDHPTEYPKGMAQPALVVLSDAGKRQLFNWHIVPDKMNLGGAKDRPLAKDVLKLVEARIKGEDDSKLTKVAKFDTAYFKTNFEPMYNMVIGYYSKGPGSKASYAKERLQIIADDLKNGSDKFEFKSEKKIASTTQSPLATLESQLKSNDHIALVFYRGNWCPFCAGYLKTIEKDFVPGFKALNGKVIAVTSESEPLAQKAKDTWGTSFAHISDPSNVLAEKFGVHITPKEKTFHKDHPTEYPKGMAQPALVVLSDAGKRQLFNWHIVPDKMNLGGAKDRPLAKDVLKLVEARIKGEDDSKLTKVAKFDTAYFKTNFEPMYNMVIGYYSKGPGSKASYAKERLQIIADDLKNGSDKIEFDSQGRKA